MDELELAGRVEAALIGRNYPDECVDCHASRTRARCSNCLMAVCSKCQREHRLEHLDLKHKHCTVCRKHRTMARCRHCRVPVCSDCEMTHRAWDGPLHLTVQGASRYGMLTKVKVSFDRR